MEKLERKTINKNDGKTYFIFEGEDALFINQVRIEFGLTNAQLAQYCLSLLKTVLEFPEIIDYINDLRSRK